MPGWLQLFSILIGFAGVCLTLLVNAYLAERRLLADIAHERLTMRAALIAELSAIDEALATRASMLQRTESFDAVIFHLLPLDELFRIYRGYAHKLGLLTPYETKRLVSLYSGLSDRLASINDNLRLVAIPSSTPGTIIVDVKNNEHADEAERTIAALDMYQRSVQEAVDLLEKASREPTTPLTVKQLVGEVRIT